MNKYIFKSDCADTNQHGSVLVMALLIMMIMSIVVMGMAADTDMDLKISRNLQLKNEAFNNAETGIAVATELLRDSAQASNEGESDSFGNIVNFSTYTVEIDSADDTFYDKGGGVKIKGSDLYSEVSVELFFPNSNKDSSDFRAFKIHATGYDGNENAKTVIQSTVIFGSTLHSAFDYGMLSEGDISSSGTPDIFGDVHANQNVSFSTVPTNESIGSITASETVSNETSIDNLPLMSAKSGEDLVDVPLVDDPAWDQEDINRWIDEGKKIIKYSLDLSGNPEVENLNPNEGMQVAPEEFFEYKGQGGHDQFESSNQDNTIEDTVILVDRSVTITGSTTLKNVTLISTGDILFRGSSKKKDDSDTNRNAIVSQGNIDFNGASSSHAVFWCNGDFDLSGSSDVVGSIVAGGSINRSGSSVFEYDENIDNDYLAQNFIQVHSSWMNIN